MFSGLNCRNPCFAVDTTANDDPAKQQQSNQDKNNDDDIDDSVLAENRNWNGTISNQPDFSSELNMRQEQAIVVDKKKSKKNKHKKDAGSTRRRESKHSTYTSNTNYNATDNDNDDNNRDLQFWLTNPRQNIRFTPTHDAIKQGKNTTLQLSPHKTIRIDPSKQYQTMDGFGFALTGGSALHIHKHLTARQRRKLLKRMFGTNSRNNGDACIGVSYLRISIGSSDLDERVFSYCDIPADSEDTALDKFSLAPDRKHLIPVLQEILQINKHIKIMASPWSAPAWMKTSKRSVGGKLKTCYYDTYAQYLCKYIMQMKQQYSIHIDAITVQNEPLHDGNNPSMYMAAAQQAVFCKDYLGPAFKNHGINDTKIIVYDHNADHIDYPISILNDPDVRQYVDGSAFHLYAGNINALSKVHEAHPDKHLYFTEQWTSKDGDFASDFKWHVRNLIIGAPRNWCRTVLEWNLASDENCEPHTQGGGDKCLGAITISKCNADDDNKNKSTVKKNQAYYVIAHASKFVRPNSIRIHSSNSSQLPNVAFLTPDGRVVVIILNDSNSHSEFNLCIGQQSINGSLDRGAVATIVWNVEKF